MSQARRDGAVRVADMVTQLGVSDVTIRRDLDALVSQGLLLKVHGGAMLPGSRTPEEPTAALTPRGPAVRADGRGQPASEGSGPTIGVLVPKSSYYFKSMVDGIRATLAPLGGRLVLAVSDYAPEREPDLAKNLLDAGAEALLLAPAAADRHTGVAAEWTCTLPAPTVLLERRAPQPHAAAVSWVRTAHENGAALAVRHLQDLGHERIALFTRGDTPTAYSVEQGWRVAVAPGLEPLCISGRDLAGWPRWEREDTRRLVDRLLHAQATALLCHSDEDALALLQSGLAELVALPGELSVVAYDDEFAEFASPSLTAVCPPKRHVGRLAVQSALDLLNEPGAPTRHIEIEPTLAVRDSTSAPTR
ncbi:substrate-binding domain-containing protein [Streptomyces sp. TRM66268-LWL]|uniref:Substrate-binding domain-containing protein n=2 Tax=Streptomyces polyasparticus TaxID=2767826 RepID=A0ABR7SVC9_9ACTN|nr:substrate-binding domain-containing protein [Streptomyces polyasparticus]